MQVTSKDVLEAKIFNRAAQSVVRGRSGLPLSDCHVERSRDISCSVSIARFAILRRPAKFPTNRKRFLDGARNDRRLQARLIVYSRTQLFKSRALLLCFQDFFLERTRSWRSPAAFTFAQRDTCLALLALASLDCIEQAFAREVSIAHLRT
jgi:hypothetical protein